MTRKLVSLSLPGCVLALALGAPAFAQSLDSLSPVCHYTASAGKALIQFKRAAPTEAAQLIKALEIFPCDVQSRSLEALAGPRAADSNNGSELDAILSQAVERSTEREAACVSHMSAEERAAVAYLTEDEAAFFALRVPCWEQRIILLNGCLAHRNLPLPRMHCSLGLRLPRELQSEVESAAIETSDLR